MNDTERFILQKQGVCSGLVRELFGQTLFKRSFLERNSNETRTKLEQRGQKIEFLEEFQKSERILQLFYMRFTIDSEKNCISLQTLIPFGKSAQKTTVFVHCTTLHYTFLHFT